MAEANSQHWYRWHYCVSTGQGGTADAESETPHDSRRVQVTPVATGDERGLDSGDDAVACMHALVACICALVAGAALVVQRWVVQRRAAARVAIAQLLRPRARHVPV
jgi:hypothetical protein